jgi:hypothetical protein
VFGCVAWDHIRYNCRKKLDAKSHGCTMMGYSEESKSYLLFDPIKQHIIMRRNVFFYEKYSGIKFLNSSSGLLQDGQFNVVYDNG